MARSFLTALFSLALLSLLTAPASAQPSELLLPNTTKGYIATHDVDELRAKFNETQLGQMVQDPAMQPFIEDLRGQIRERFDRAGRALGITLDDLDGVSSGEVALALIQPDPRDKASHATALIVDVTDKQPLVQALLNKIDANQRAKGATRDNVQAGGVRLTRYTQPLKRGQKEPDRTLYFIHNNRLVVTDHLHTAAGIAGRFGGMATDTLASVPAFEFIMARHRRDAGETRHHVRWFVEPFGYVEATRATADRPRRRGTDMLKIIQGQGFPAIQGIGGQVFFATDNLEMLHRTYVYAPPVRGAKEGEKYTLAMRMLDFPNSAAPGDLDPQPWALPDVASYLTFNWRMKEAFAYSETLVDAIAGEKGVFEEIWLSMRTDPHGPKIDIYGGLVNHLGTRATILSDVVVPVTLKSERLMALVEINPGAADIVAGTVEKAFEKDPHARKRVFQGHVIWEITPDEQVADADAIELSIEGAGFVAAADTEQVAQRPARPGGGGGAAEPLPNMAVTVFNNHLVVATHVDFIEKLIAGVGGGGLAATMDFQRVDAELKRLGSANDSFRMFSRTDESYRATYELLRKNALPQSETLLARVLNAITQPDAAPGERRRQEIDGSKLPPFEQVQKYLGPSGLYVQTEQDGWIVVGCLLRK